MSTISLRLPDSLHERARELAEKVSALMTEDYLGERARRGSKAKFRKAMSKVADAEPEEQDQL